MQTVIAPKSPLTKTTPVLHLPEAHLFPHVPQLFGSQRLTHAPPQQIALPLGSAHVSPSGAPAHELKAQ